MLSRRVDFPTEWQKSFSAASLTVASLWAHVPTVSITCI